MKILARLTKKEFHNRFHSFFQALQALSPEMIEKLKRDPGCKLTLDEHPRFCDHCIAEKLATMSPTQRTTYHRLGSLVAAFMGTLQRRKEKTGIS